MSERGVHRGVSPCKDAGWKPYAHDPRLESGFGEAGHTSFAVPTEDKADSVLHVPPPFRGLGLAASNHDCRLPKSHLRIGLTSPNLQVPVFRLPLTGCQPKYGKASVTLSKRS